MAPSNLTGPNRSVEESHKAAYQLNRCPGESPWFTSCVLPNVASGQGQVPLCEKEKKRGSPKGVS